jgi:hypothetical protein
VKTIIGIDGGKSGAIAIAQGGVLEIIKMPSNARALMELFTNYDPDDTVVFLEKVSAFVGEDQAKKYAIIKMLEQVKELKTVMEIQGFTYAEIASVTWQSNLGLRFKGLSKAERKQKYFEYAKRFASKNKVTKYAGDAVCILACGLKFIKDQNPLVGGVLDSKNYPDIF